MGLVTAGLALGIWSCLHRDATAESKAPDVAAVELVVLATAHEEEALHTDVRLVAVDGDGARSTPWATIRHPPGSVVRGDVRGRVAFVVGDEEGASDRDWGAALYRVEAGKAAQRLAGGVGHAGLPLASEDGFVYVERGQSGPLPSPGSLREDALSLDAVDPSSGLTRALYTWTGYALHLAGELGRELILYRVGGAGAELLAIDRASGASRRITSLAPFARDFSVDSARSAIVLANRDAQDAHRWVVLRIDLASGASTELASAIDDAPAPFALPQGSVVYSAPGRTGLLFDAPIGAAPLAPLGAGFDAVRAATPDGAWIALLHVPARGYDESVAVHLRTRRVVRLVGHDERVEVAGFLGGQRGVR